MVGWGEKSFVQDPVIAHAERHGWLHRKVRYAGRAGAPDDWFFKAGRLIVIEFKAPGKEPELHQGREIKRLREAGMEVHVIDDAEDGYALFG